MKMLEKIKSWILPKEIDFFKALAQQGLQTQNIIDTLRKSYVESASQNHDALFKLIAEAKENQSANLKNLNAAFITPVDREAIARAHTQLFWVTLSIKHLVIEIDTYRIYNLSEYQSIFELLQQEMSELVNGYQMLHTKTYDKALENIDQIIHLDNKVIKLYANFLAELFKDTDLPRIFMHKEILSQLKEISKRMHVCANLLEDIIFKLN